MQASFRYPSYILIQFQSFHCRWGLKKLQLLLLMCEKIHLPQVHKKKKKMKPPLSLYFAYPYSILFHESVFMTFIKSI